MTFEKDQTAKLLQITESLNHIKDIDALLDRILLEARKFTNADAGTIYLVDNKKLKFAYVQNDTLIKKDTIYNKYIYKYHEMDVNKNSLSGYVALTGKSLIIDDAYQIPKNIPCTFNKSFDEKSNYRSKAILTVPLKTSAETVVGVIQIINAKDKKGNLVKFTQQDKLLVTYFATNAAIAIERAKMTRNMILRTIKMAELRDPRETGEHVNRVGAYSIEIYEKWAQSQGLSMEEIKKFKDVLRIAAMLHDVGKVAISDTILKKPAKLDKNEYEIIKYHTIYGARLFKDPTSDMEVISAQVCLSHHERWDGHGYPGKIKNIYADDIKIAGGKKREEIPVSGRIVALADVYDALISRRVYKNPWPEQKALDYIKEMSGRQFDPEVVHAFFSIYDIIKAIKDRFKDEA
ncbi:MAG: HD domain-containing protein [Spirochaetes bacterium]|nr:HD domain-containing protein [Spirochaetota bacterium]